VEIDLIELVEPNGWIHIPLKDRNEKMVKAFMLQVSAILFFIFPYSLLLYVGTFPLHLADVFGQMIFLEQWG